MDLSLQTIENHYLVSTELNTNLHLRPQCSHVTLIRGYLFVTAVD